MSPRKMEVSSRKPVEFEAHGSYVGECRLLFNILEQWNGRKWVRVPDVKDNRQHQRPSKLHFPP
jgi:hypothetical protein